MRIEERTGLATTTQLKEENAMDTLLRVAIRRRFVADARPQLTRAAMKPDTLRLVVGGVFGLLVLVRLLPSAPSASRIS